MREECDRIGRDPGEIEVTAGLPVQSPDDAKRYQELGISRLVMPPPAFDPDGLRKGLDRFGSDIIAKL